MITWVHLNMQTLSPSWKDSCHSQSSFKFEFENLNFQVVDGTASLSIRLDRYNNAEGDGANGHCCDGRGIFCSGACDHYFIICLDQPYRYTPKLSLLEAILPPKPTNQAFSMLIYSDDMMKFTAHSQCIQEAKMRLCHHCFNSFSWYFNM